MGAGGRGSRGVRDVSISVWKGFWGVVETPFLDGQTGGGIESRSHNKGQMSNDGEDKRAAKTGGRISRDFLFECSVTS